MKGDGGRSIVPYVLGTIALGWLLLMGGDAGTLGDRIADSALAHVGWGASADAQAFGDWLGGDGETEDMKMGMATAPISSTCGLAVRAEWRDAGVGDPNLQPPYHIGTVITDEIAYAEGQGAWVANPTFGQWPERGSMVAVGPPSGITHVYTVTGVDPTTGVVTSVDGGMVDAAGKQIVGTHTRQWVDAGGGVIGDHPDNAVARVVFGWSLPSRMS